MFLSRTERSTLEAIASLTYCNPFVTERIHHERLVLGDEFVPIDPVWHSHADLLEANENVQRVSSKAEQLGDALHQRLVGGPQVTSEEVALYHDLVVYVLYNRYEARFLEVIQRSTKNRNSRRVGFYERFSDDLEHYLGVPGVGLPEANATEHLFACFFQVRRAFHFIFRHIIGGSKPAARLRAQIWESIFSHDLRRYRRTLFRRMGDISTLISGPSGTGKELVARAIGLSRYIPFNSKTGSFSENFEASFFPLNLSALSPTLIESELFGHRRGAFTGAVADRTGWLEVCPPLGTVFLDEIGEIDADIQVKLLRALDTRTFQRLGETKSRDFHGKAIAATNRDLAREMRQGRFRDDLYYRLCSDTIALPSLHERVADEPQELSDLVFFLAHRQFGEEDAPELAREVVTWIDKHLGRDYQWPGNVRELRQCMSNILIRRSYTPAVEELSGRPRSQLAEEFLQGRTPASDMLTRYFTLAYARHGNYQRTARALGVDRRTVKSKVDDKLLAELRAG